MVHFILCIVDLVHLFVQLSSHPDSLFRFPNLNKRKCFFLLPIVLLCTLPHLHRSNEFVITQRNRRYFDFPDPCIMSNPWTPNVADASLVPKTIASVTRDLIARA